MCSIFDCDDKQIESLQKGIYFPQLYEPGICPGIVSILQRCEKKNNSMIDVGHEGEGNLHRTIRLNHILIKELSFP